jgi:hypothetical protein
MLIFQFVHTNRIAISVSKCELQRRSFTAQWDFLFLFFSFLRKSGKLQSNHTGPVLCLDMGKRISKLIPPNLSFQLNNFIVASDGEGEKQQPCHLPFSYHVLVTCHRLVGVKNCHGNYLDSDPLVKV